MDVRDCSYVAYLIMPHYINRLFSGCLFEMCFVIIVTANLKLTNE